MRTGPSFHISRREISMFALRVVAGAVAAPIAGRVADRGWTQPATALAMLLALGGFALTGTVAPGSTLSLTALVVAAIAIDFGVQANVVLGHPALSLLVP